MKKYAICGVSNRALRMFIAPILDQYAKNHQVVALLDQDPRRLEIAKEQYPQLASVRGYDDQSFEQMMNETKPDVLLVCSRDDTHIDYILKGLAHDLHVITEKPMVTTAKDAKRVIEAENKSRGKVTVTFNYRYGAHHRKIKELILEGRLGRITSIDFNWYIDTYHGASYFKRWNRVRDYSGGLSIHKSTHHFDLVNWWVDQRPIEAFAYGALNYYGADGELNPSKKNGRFCGTCDEQDRCQYYRRWTTRSQSSAAKDDHIEYVPSTAKLYTDYRPDACIFDEEINIEDTYVATVRYDRGTLLSYSINFSTPYEGYHLVINGTKGRIETKEYHEPSRIPFPFDEQTIDYYPLFGSKETIHVVTNEGGHGGGDPILLEDLFLGVDPARPYEILAGAQAGADSIAVGEAVWRSVQTGQPIKIDDLLKVEVQQG
ncbi:Gfo/Idh/MocA family oxidoreductase [Halalkalibacterium halodurans]|uniref:BH0487 protein n=1 Tax=Halalkalibacterium halodurans (strain ATCC BAA-125 / DSM 18197 / FERM 7344 / JCM 9153 / C-125) TaxID=272558 RepID=Q9KFJ2_HALH5|nr:Gfo/Idh/MocA family oxidoreductase [Halalkalibacterium halodurans]MED4079875.1 Gfo/Idh/MocA family oxidoreductase [Halalkalibacterium halodurans]MED4085306.1 Gfo/Idh/MocA family oxidoreductase [Halalkalibacterium halodurans]MED4103839.1 Gfo/Idh/MocA family oxidoreductase [Halalkalibacterium halodurans]MED4107206.1 Gfo/Idh/MocA family oxidoreductase [Halalkalibacterium halodurans]MED4122770.1 Gfo/Idh/MocA family oxidoreductase [Halalkalibacterium halodurans]